MARFFLMLAGIYGFLGVALGAFGAHALRARFAALADAQERLKWWETAASYHLVHSLALGLAAFAMWRLDALATRVSASAFALGTPLFAGSLYILALTGQRVWGAVTPLGGLCFLVGWASLACAGWQCR